MLGYLELNGLPHWALHVLGMMLLLGRLLHGYAFAFTRNSVVGRSGGIALTMLSLLAGGLLCLWRGLGG
jgi:uncharacterized membrane protein YecN with MAPEG domain